MLYLNKLQAKIVKKKQISTHILECTPKEFRNLDFQNMKQLVIRLSCNVVFGFLWTYPDWRHSKHS